MTIVGIDVSKGKSMVAAMKPGGELVAAPYEVKSIYSDVENTKKIIKWGAIIGGGIAVVLLIVVIVLIFKFVY